MPEGIGAAAVRWSRRGWLWPAAGGLLTTGIGLLGSGRPELWYDEAASLSAADRPLSTLPKLLRHVDLVHGFYYALLHLWSQVWGTSPAALRSLSAVALGVGCAGFVVFARKISGRTGHAADVGGVVAGATFVLLPGLAWSATEAREWSLTVAVTMWAMVAAAKATGVGEKGTGTRTSTRWWVCATVLTVLGIVLSVMTAFMVVPQLWLAWRRHRLRPGAISAAVAVLVTAPWFYAAFTQRGQIAWIHLTTSRLVNQVLVNQLFAADQHRRYPHSFAVGIVLACVFTLVGAAGLAARRPGAWLGLVWVVVPTACLALPVVAGVQLYQARYLTFAAPGACLVFAEGFVVVAGWVKNRENARPRRLAVAALLAALVAAGGSSSALAQRAARDRLAKGGQNYAGLAAMARGADQVFYMRPDARGIAIAYPHDFAGVTDALLRASPAASGTLWGTDAPYRTARPHGAVVAYTLVRTFRKHHGNLRILQYLRAEGCVLTAQMHSSWWMALRYACTPPATQRPHTVAVVIPRRSGIAQVGASQRAD